MTFNDMINVVSKKQTYIAHLVGKPLMCWSH